jgi:CRP-like cAMP-binding protein
MDRGFVKIMLPMPDGTIRTIDIIGPSGCLGILALARQGTQPFRIETLDSVSALAIPADAVRQVLRTTPEFAEKTLSMLVERLEMVTQQLLEMHLGSVSARLAATLLHLARRYGNEVCGAVQIDIPLVQQDLAEMVGANRSTINQWLGWFESLGVITRQGRRIAILDLENLRVKAQ